MATIVLQNFSTLSIVQRPTPLVLLFLNFLDHSWVQLSYAMFARQPRVLIGSLPKDVLRVILCKVPLRSRLTKCSLVCKTWRTAAVAATDSMQLDSCKAPESLQLYLKQYGQHLNSFSLKMLDEQQLMHLPCSTLQELRLHGGKLQPAVLHAPAATLTKLVLESWVQLFPAAAAASPGSAEVFLKQVDSSSTGYFAGASGWHRPGWGHPPFFEPDTQDSGSAADGDAFSDDSSDSPMRLSSLAQQFHNVLIQLSNLQHLELEYCGDSSSSSRFGLALPHLTALTHLKLWWWCINPNTWRQNLSTLTALRVLHLDSTDGEYAVSEHVLDGVQHLQLLTALRLKRLAIRISQHSSSTLGRLTGLQELDLDYSSCDLSALSGVTGLRSLALDLQDPAPHYSWDTMQQDMEAAAVDKHHLQATLLRLQHLTYLSIRGQYPPHDAFWDLPAPAYDEEFDMDMTGSVSSGDSNSSSSSSSSAAGSEDNAEPETRPAESAVLPGMEVFQAFTASSCMQHLDLSEAAMQFHTWQYMFPAGHQALQLTCLQGPSALYDRRDLHGFAAEGPYSLTADDVKAMVCCCPNLQALEARNILHVSPELGPLQQLTRLEAKWGAHYYLATLPGGCCDGFLSIWCKVDKAAAARALAGLTNLQYLYLAGAQGLGAELCTALLQLTRLTWLDLGMRKAALSDAEAGLLARLTGLSVLKVSRCSLTEEQLLQLAALPQLTELYFSNTGLGPLFKASVTDSIVRKEGCEEPHGVMCSMVERINQHYQQTLQQHNSKQAQAAAELKAASTQQQSLQRQLHALQQEKDSLQQQLAEAVAIAQQHQHDLGGVVHLIAQQREQLDGMRQELADARQINMQQRQRLARHF